MNIEKLTENVPIFGTTGPNARKTRPTNLDKLSESGVNFNTYGIREGEILRFPKLEDMELRDVQVQPGSDIYTTLVKCESEYTNPKTNQTSKTTTWFSLATLRRRDADNEPIQPTWYNLGNDRARLEGLAKMGEIKGEGTIQVEVPKFVNNKRVEVEVLNDDGTPVIENGKVKVTYDNKITSVTVISEYAE